MPDYDLYAIGNALVDSEYQVSDEQLATMGIAKRHMTLIDPARRAELLAAVEGMPTRRTGGGSAANTVVALAQLGGKGFYSCRVADDALGAFYRDDLMASGVQTNLSAGLASGLGASGQASAAQTGCCMVMITPDAERSMSTFLGVSSELDASALNQDAIAKARIYYMEGYLAASPTGLAAALQGRAIARQSGVALAATLSDMSMINFCRPGLDAMVGDGLDYLFCNEEESQTWCGSQDLTLICQHMGQLAKVVCLTRSAKGCIVMQGGQTTTVPSSSVKAIDTNGAGDMFAGAFLYAATQGYPLEKAAWLANQAAGRVVSQVGPRLDQAAMSELKALFEAHRGA
jgi:sugar/nucleoside kinase (ribokinase family)